MIRAFLLIIFLIVGSWSLIAQQKQAPDHLPNTFRMNQNIHYISSDKDKQLSLIDNYLSKGYGGFAVNFSYNDYLTESGMNAFKSFCELAKANSMELWLYDEQGYPSGSAGGRVFLQNEEWEAKGIFKQDTLVTGGQFKYGLPKGEIINVYAINKTDTLDLEGYLVENILNWKAPDGEWRLIVFYKNNLYHHFQVSMNPHAPREKLSSHYPSLMIPEVTQAFIDITHKKYAELLGKDPGKYFASTFTDEPSLMAISFFKEKWSVIPWTELVSQTIEKKYGYKPEDKLLELFNDKGGGGQKIRHQYFHTISELISLNYFKQLKDWCAQHNIKSGGHLLLEETMMAHVPLYGSVMSCFRQMDAPGVDALSCLPENTPVHATKLASSAAELTGASRVMCEPCPVIDKRALGGKEPATERVRGFMNIQLAAGVTDFNNYLKLSNADDEEKQEFNQYVARIAESLRGGHSVADIAILYPIESLWADFIPEPMQVSGWDSVRGGNPKAIYIEQSFRNTARILYKNRWEYNIIDIKAIEDSKVKDGRLVHGKLKWRLVILPNVSTLSMAAMTKLKDFVEEGGYVIAIGQTPVNSTINFPDSKIEAIVKELFDSPNTIKLDAVSGKIDSQIEKWIQRDLMVGSTESALRFTHRFINSKHVYFVFNDSNSTVDSKISLRDLKKGFLLHPVDGEVSNVKDEMAIQLTSYEGVIIKE
ncbi:glycosyl hydrolase [Sunxiuqinia sp. A32]|uniref:glycosyl hydrolase n=1 Tax=Sunxiuqinia sp. A32 TaxID=3461496 RepID=UPI004046025C